MKGELTQYFDRFGNQIRIKDRIYFRYQGGWVYGQIINHKGQLAFRFKEAPKVWRVRLLKRIDFDSAKHWELA